MGDMIIAVIIHLNPQSKQNLRHEKLMPETLDKAATVSQRSVLKSRSGLYKFSRPTFWPNEIPKIL